MKTPPEKCPVAGQARLSPLRVQGRHAAAEAYGKARRALHAAGHAECSANAIRAHYGLGSKHLVEDWSTPDSGVAITLGDLIAGPRALTVETLRTLLEELEGSAPTRVAADPRNEVMRIGSRVARAGDRACEFAENDGVTDAHEWEQMEGEFANIERDARAGRRACAAARELLTGRG